MQKHKATRKEQYAPRQWGTAPEQGQRAIFTVMDAFAILDRSTGKAARFEPAAASVGGVFWGYPVDDLIDRYNRGEYWVQPQ